MYQGLSPRWCLAGWWNSGAARNKSGVSISITLTRKIISNGGGGRLSATGGGSYLALHRPPCMVPFPWPRGGRGKGSAGLRCQRNLSYLKETLAVTRATFTSPCNLPWPCSPFALYLPGSPPPSPAPHRPARTFQPPPNLTCARTLCT